MPAVTDTRRAAGDPFLLPWAGRPAGTPPAYITPQGRDLRIDLLRGFFVFAMIVDHVRGASPLHVLTGGNRFFTSAAEGFILTSGLMAGLIYGRIVMRDGIVAAARKVLARAFTLYLVTVALTFFLLPLSEALGLPWAEGVDLSQPVSFVVGVLTLHRTYYLADVMLLYTLLFLLLPLALILLAGGKTRLLLAGSWLLWGLYQLFPAETTATWPIAGNYLFAFSAWQLLFFNGLALGFQRERLPSPTPAGARRLQIGAGIATVTLIALYFVLTLPAATLPPQLAGLRSGFEQAQLWAQQYLFGKADLRPGRVVASAVVFTFMFLTLTRQWRWLQRPLAWLLAPLGQNALYAFTAHVVVVAGVALALKPFGLAADSPQWLNALIQVASVLLIWRLAKGHVLESSPRAKMVWRISPAVLATAALVSLPWLPVSAAPLRGTPTASVSDAVLARARAYGTPVTSLNRTAGVAARTTTPSAPIVQPRATPAPAQPTAPIAATETIAAPAPQTIVFHVASPSIHPTATPAAPEITVAAPPTTRSGASQNESADPEIGQSRPAPQEIGQGESRALPPAATPATAATKAPVATAAVAAAKSAAVSALQAANVISSEPLPPLPPDSERLVSPYVGSLAGRAYMLSFHSQLLDREMPYWIYLPPGYGMTNRRYPVLYALHGGGGELDEWAAYGLFDAADQAMRTAALLPFIIVLPQGDVSYWANWSNDSPRWGDYLAYEVVGQVDARFGTLRTPASRAIGGLSMGGWGALYQAFTHPDIFGIAAAHSPSLYPDDNNLKFLGVGAEFASKDPLALAATAPQLDTLRIWLDLGETDPWLPPATALHQALQARGVAHQWRVYPGGHNGAYWALHIPDYLRFYADAFPGR